jgi:hypothetical protein
MLRRSAGAVIASSVLFAALGSAVLAQQQRVVTVKELFASNHQLAVDAGTEVVWADPHFERVWFPSNTGPAVKRARDGFVSVFATPGTYRGRFTVVAGHGTAGEVYSVTVTVKNP